MKNPTLFSRILFTIIFAASTVIPAAAQLRNGGEVLEVIDGKTVVVAVPTGRVTVELQYIDVPEPAQALHGVVKDHVRAMLLGKFVEVHTTGFTRGKVNGKLLLNGVDVSQQLLRNGAAWHFTNRTSGQRKDEFDTYAESESLARQEKRGIWSVAGLEPAWQFRAKATTKKQEVMPVQTVAATAVSKRKGYWSDKNPWMKDPGGMTHGFNAATKTGFLGTTLLGVTPNPSQPQPPGQKTAVELTYFYTENGKKGRTGYFVVTVVSLADDWRFLRDNSLTVEIDGKNFPVGKPKRETDKSSFQLGEKLTYRVDVAMVEKIANGGSVVLKIGDYGLFPKAGLQMILYNMLQAAK